MRNTDWAALDRPLTEDEKAWLAARERFDVIDANSAKFDSLGDDDGEAGETEGTQEQEDPGYEKWSAADLKAEAARREIDITDMRKKSEVAAALRADDAGEGSDESTK